MTTALVLGGSVFVGRHLFDALLADGHWVVVLKRGQTEPRAMSSSSPPIEPTRRPAAGRAAPLD